MLQEIKIIKNVNWPLTMNLLHELIIDLIIAFLILLQVASLLGIKFRELAQDLCPRTWTPQSLMRSLQ
jgi:hypothetical protein